MGYFKLERGWSEHPVFDDEPLTQREAWVWLIEHAAWKDTVMSVGVERYRVQRGQLAASVRYLAARWQWSKSRVGRFLNRLKSETMIGTEERTHASIISICNYAKYQDTDDDSGTASGTDDGTAAGQQRDSSGTKKKQVKQGKQVNIYSSEFEEFWSLYPRREVKPKAAKAYAAAIKRAPHSEIMAGLKRHRFSDDPQFHPMPASWLNGDRWTDEPPKIRPGSDIPGFRPLGPGGG